MDDFGVDGRESYYKKGLIQGRRDGLLTGIPVGFGLLVGMTVFGITEHNYHAELTGDEIEDLVIERRLFGVSGPILLYQGRENGSYQMIENPIDMQKEAIEALVVGTFSSDLRKFYF